MADRNDSRPETSPSEDWIELDHVAGRASGDSASHSALSMNQGAHSGEQHPVFSVSSEQAPLTLPALKQGLPNLKLDTSQLDPPSDDEASHDPPPQSAILNLAKGSNFTIGNWLPDSKPSVADKLGHVSPSKSLKRRRNSSIHSRSTGGQASPLSSSPISHTANNRRDRRLSRSRASHSSDTGRPITPIPQVTLTVERSFEGSGQETPLYITRRSSYYPENVFDDSYAEGEEVLDHHRSASLRSVLRSRSPSPTRRGSFLSPTNHESQDDDSSLRPRFSSAKSAQTLHPSSAAHASTSSVHVSPKKSSTKSHHNLILSGAAFAAQQDFLDAEERGSSIQDPTQSHRNEDQRFESSDTEDRSEEELTPVYTHDTYGYTDSEKISSVEKGGPIGRSLFYFRADHKLRQLLYKIVASEFARYFDLLLTVLQVIALCVETWSPLTEKNGLPLAVNLYYLYTYAGLYCFFSLQAIAKCIAYGVVTNEIITRDEAIRKVRWITRYLCRIVTLGSVKAPRGDILSKSRSGRSMCFLRKSWGRVELLSIVFFWSMVGISTKQEIDSLNLIIAGLGHLRILRLLDEFSYTHIVLHVIKTAVPLLQNVLIFIAFFLAVWGVTGLQSFNGSLRRVCIYEGYITSQNCGSWLEPNTLEVMPYMLLDSSRGTYLNQTTSKGYTCPAGSTCVELRAFPPSGSFSSMANQSFDNIFNSLEIVFIMMSNNGFTQIMYQIIDSEYLASSLFFITGVLILGIWLMNLLVAVMVSSYASVRHKFDDRLDDTLFIKLAQKVWRLTLGRVLSSKRSTSEGTSVDSEDSGSSLSPSSENGEKIEENAIAKARDRGQWILRNSPWGKRYSLVYPLFAILALVDLIVQASRTSPSEHLFGWELGLAIVYGTEILFRFWVFLPYWRYFFYSVTNLIDLALAIVNCFILAFYNQEEVYAWLTLFQLFRVYRLVGAFKYSRIFWLQVFGNFKALASLTAFFFLCTFLSTLVAVKMLRGQFPMETDGSINVSSFYQLAAGFFSMYQVASTENWTDVLFWAIDNVSSPGSDVIGLACMGILFCGWLFFANFLVFNLFVGIMSESLHGAISNKREEQVRQFFEQVKESSLVQRGPLLGNILQSFSPKDNDEKQSDKPVKFREKLVALCMRWFHLSADENVVVSAPMRLAIERQFVVEFLEVHGNLEHFKAGKVAANQTFLSLQDGKDEQIYGFESYATSSIVVRCKRALLNCYRMLHHYPRDYQEFSFRRLEELNAGSEDPQRAYINGLFEYNNQALAILDEYCMEHKNFDRPLFLFKRQNALRLLCQRLVPPSNGARLSGVNPKNWVRITMRLFFLLATISIVVQTCITTPLRSFDKTGDGRHVVWSYKKFLDLIYGIIFTIEFLIKVIADGFHFTPNAYTWSVWNCLDLVVLISIWMTLINDLLNGVTSQYLRALLALRALRLISFFRGTELLLSSVFTYGLRNLLGATLIAFSIVIPYSVWGKNIFHGRLGKCNDGNVGIMSNCTGEFVNTVFSDFEVLAPRVVQENYFNYNNFWQSLLIQFGVLSLEGWVDVLDAVTSITGPNEQPSTYASKGNAAYPIVYHYIGAVLIMTMLVCVIIRNYALTMGTAFLTEQQLSWMDVKRTLRLLKPTPKPPQYKYGSLRHQLLTITPTWINSLELWSLFIASVDMAAYFYPSKERTQHVYQLILVSCSMMLAMLSVIRLIVLKPTLYFHNWWNPFGLLVCLSVTIFTITTLTLPDSASGSRSACRAAEICLLLLWIPRTKTLYQFYTISTAAIAEISVLLRAWLALYITYAIALNQSFGLTKLGSQSTWSRNFRTIPKALIALFTMSCGEGWNQLLIDYTISKPYCYSNSRDNECGIPGFAYFLFITWNIISMYVFANLFISLVCEACWYVYRSGPVNISERDIVNLLDSWQQFDPRGTEFIRTKDLFKFLGRTQGYFSLSIFSQDPKYNVHRIVAETQQGARNVVDPYYVDMNAINTYLQDLPVQKYRERRSLYELFATHAQLMSYSVPGGRGIRFQKLTLMFPLYKDMNPADTLTLKEFIVLRVQLHEARVTLAANFIVKRWRLRCKMAHSSTHTNSDSETPGLGYDQSWTHSKTRSSVYWVS
nr:Cch1 [Starmerella bombicola]